MVTDQRKKTENSAPVLWVIATPIGNLSDFSARACEVLQQVDEVLAEDTRHSKRLLSEYNISKPVSALHEHNETARIDALVTQMHAGKSFALLSDAGTPLVSDPGYRLVRACGEAELLVSTVPGACAAIAALSVAGLPSDQFHFYGFLPGKANARRQQLQTLDNQQGSLIFYESPRRLIATLEDMFAVFGSDREACLCREMTKQFETIRRLPLQKLLAWVKEDTNQQRGEIVIVVSGNSEDRQTVPAEMVDLYRSLADVFPPAKVAAIMARHLPIKKADLYASR